MMDQQGPATRQGQTGGLWGDLQNFQNPHGDFGAPTAGPGAARMPRAPAPVVPPSEESIEMLMVYELYKFAYFVAIELLFMHTVGGIVSI